MRPFRPPPIAAALIFHCERCAAAITCEEGVQEGQAQVPPQSVPKFLSGEVRSILQAGKNRDPASSIACTVHFAFGYPVNGCSQGIQLSFL